MYGKWHNDTKHNLWWNFTEILDVSVPVEVELLEINKKLRRTQHGAQLLREGTGMVFLVFWRFRGFRILPYITIFIPIPEGEPTNLIGNTPHQLSNNKNSSTSLSKSHGSYLHFKKISPLSDLHLCPSLVNLSNMLHHPKNVHLLEECPRRPSPPEKGDGKWSIWIFPQVN